MANVVTGTYNNTLGDNGSSLNIPIPIAYDGVRYLYAGNSNSTITRFDTSINDVTGTQLTLNRGAGVPTTEANILLLNGLVTGLNGALYATNGSRGDVFRIATPSAASSTFTLFTGGLQGPEGLAFEPGTSNLYVASDDDTILRILPTGSVTTGFVVGAVDPTFSIAEAEGSGPTFLAFPPIPEPSTYALFGVAGVALLVFSLRRRHSLTLRA